MPTTDARSLVADHPSRSMDDAQLIEALRVRLHTSGPKPKPEVVAAALSMARDTSLETAAVCDAAGVAWWLTVASS